MIKKLCAQLMKRGILRRIRFRKKEESNDYQEVNQQREALLDFLKTLDKINR